MKTIKNPNIMEVFKQIGRADELGSGVRNVFKYGKLYGSAEPVFEEGDVFKSVISTPKIYSVKAKSEGSSRVTGKLPDGNDTEGIQSDTEKGESDTEKVKSDTEKNIDRIIGVLDETVVDTVTEKVKFRLAQIIEILITSPGLKPGNLAKKLDVSEVTIKRDIQKIKDLVEYKGGQKTGGYYLSSIAVEKLKL